MADTPNRLAEVEAEIARLNARRAKIDAALARMAAPEEAPAPTPVPAPAPAPALAPAAVAPPPQLPEVSAQPPAPAALAAPATKPMALPAYTRPAPREPQMSTGGAPLTRADVMRMPGGEFAIRKAESEAERAQLAKLPEVLTAPLATGLDPKALEGELAARQKTVDDLTARLARVPAQAIDARDALDAQLLSARQQLGVTRYLASAPSLAPTEFRAFSDQEIAKGEELYRNTQDPRLPPVLEAQKQKRAALYTLGEKEAQAIARTLKVPFEERTIAIGFSPDGKLVVDSTQYELPIFLKERENIAREMGFSSYATVPQEFETAFKDAQKPAATPDAVQDAILTEAARKAKAEVQRAFQRSRNLTLYDPDPESTTLKIAALPPYLREFAAVFTPTAARTQSPVATEFMPERPGAGFMRALGALTAPFVARFQAYSASDRPEMVTAGLSEEEARRLAEAPITGLPRALASAAVGDPVTMVQGQLSTLALLLGGRTRNLDEAARVVAAVREDPIFAQYLADEATKAYDATVQGEGDPTTRAAIGLGFGALGFVGLDMAMPDPVGLSLLGASMGLRSATRVGSRMDRIGEVTRAAAQAETFDDGLRLMSTENPTAATLATQMVAVDSMFNESVKGSIRDAGRIASEAQTKLDNLVLEAQNKGLIQGGEIQDIAMAREAQALQQQIYAAQLEATTGQIVAVEDAINNFDQVSGPTLKILEGNIQRYKKVAATLPAEEANLAAIEKANKPIYDRVDGFIATEQKAQQEVVTARAAYEAAVTAKREELVKLGDAVTQAQAAVDAATDIPTRSAAVGKLTEAKRALAEVSKNRHPLNVAIADARTARNAADTALKEAATARKNYMAIPQVETAWTARAKAVRKVDNLTGQIDALGTSIKAHGIDLNDLDNVVPDRALRNRLIEDLKTAREQRRLLASTAKTEAKKLPEIERVFKAAVDAETAATRANRWRASLNRFAEQVSEGGKRYQQVLDVYGTREPRFTDVLGPDVAREATLQERRMGIERVVQPTERGFLVDALRGRVTEPEKVAEALLSRGDELGEVLQKIETGVKAGRRVPLSRKETTLLQQSLYDLARETDLVIQEDPFQLVRAIRIAEEADPSLRPRIIGGSWSEGYTINLRATVPKLLAQYRAIAQGMDPIVAGTGIKTNEVIANVVRMVRNMSAQVDDEFMTFVRRADFSNLDPEIIRKVADLTGYDLEGRKLKDELLPGLLQDIQAKLRNRVVLSAKEANLVQAAAVVQYMDTTKGLVYPGGKTFVNTLSPETMWQRARTQMLRDPRIPKQLGLKPRPPEAGPVPLPPTPPTTPVQPTPMPARTVIGGGAPPSPATTAALRGFDEVPPTAATPPVTAPTPPAVDPYLPPSLGRDINIPLPRMPRAAPPPATPPVTAPVEPGVVPTPTPPITAQDQLETLRVQLGEVQAAQAKAGWGSPEWNALLPERLRLRREYLKLSQSYGDLPFALIPVTPRKYRFSRATLEEMEDVYRRDPVRRKLEAIPNGSPLKEALAVVQADTKNPVARVVIKRLLEEAGEIDRAKFFVLQRGDKANDFELIRDASGISLYPRNPGEPIAVVLNGASRAGLGEYGVDFTMGKVLVHEAVHVVTQLRIEAAAAPTASLALKNAVSSADKLFREVTAIASKQGKLDQYGFTNLHEFMAEGLSNPKFQEYLKSIEMPGEEQTLWTKFTRIIADILGISNETALTRLTGRFEELLAADAPRDVRSPFWSQFFGGNIPVGRGAVDEFPGIRPRPNAGTIDAPPSPKLEADSPKIMDPSHHPPDDISEIPPPPPGLIDEGADARRVADEGEDLDEAQRLDGGEGEPPDGAKVEGEEPPKKPEFVDEGFVEPEAFRALVRSWLPPTAEARIAEATVRGIERRAYALLRKNEEEGGDFFKFMQDLRALTYARLQKEGAEPTGLLRTDPRFARVFGFGGRAAAHAAILKSADDALSLGMMPFTRDQLNGAMELLRGEYRNVGDFVRALRVFNALGQPATITTAVKGSGLEGAVKNTVKLLRMAENPGGQDVWTTTFTLQELESNIPRILKELDARPAQARIPLGAYGANAYRTAISLWKTSAVTGLLLPNPRYYLNNIVGDFSQMWFEMGVYQAAKQSFTNLPVQIPVVGNATQIMLSKFSEKMGGVPVLGSVTNALFNPYLARVWDGSKGAIRLKNGASLIYDDLRRWLVEDGILDTFVHEELLQSFSEVVPTLWDRTFRGWQKNMEQHANFVQQRQRSGLYLDLIRQGYTRAEAKRLTLNALYDWKNGVAKGELQGLANNIAFYRFWKLALGQFNRAVMEPFTTAQPGRYLQQAITGQTQFGRLRQMYQTTDKIVAPALQQPDEEATTVEGQLDDMARAIYPMWMVGRGPTFSKRLDDEARRQFQVTQGRFVSDAAITLPRMTPFDIVAQYSALVTPIIFGSAAYLSGESSVAGYPTTPDYWKTSLQTTIEQFGPAERDFLESALGLSKDAKGDVRITPAEALVLDAIPFASTPYRDPETGEFRSSQGQAVGLRFLPLFGMQLTRVMSDALVDNPKALVAYDRYHKIAQLRAAARIETDPEERQKFAQAAAALDAQQGDTIEDAAGWFFMRSLGVGPYPYSIEQINSSLARDIGEDLKAKGKMAAMPSFEGYIYGEGQEVPAERIMREVMGED